MNIVYITCSENGLYGLKFLLSKGIKFTRVVTIAKEVAEKYNVSGFIDITTESSISNLNLIKLNEYNISVKDFNGEEVDLFIVNGWNRLIKKEVIQYAKYGGFGIHAGHPPIGFGRAPLPWNIIKGFKDLEVYVFRLTPDADDGDIIARQTVEITPFDNVRTLYEKVMYQGAYLFELTLKQFFSGGISYFPQNKEYSVFYPKRTPEDGWIDFKDSVENVYNFIRAQTSPYPGAYTYLDGQKWHIWEAIPFDSFSFREEPRIPGRIVAALPSGIVVQTGSSPLWVRNATCMDKVMILRSLDKMEQYVGKVFLSYGKNDI